MNDIKWMIPGKILWLDKLRLLLANKIVMHGVKEDLKINLSFHENCFVIYKYSAYHIASLSLMA